MSPTWIRTELVTYWIISRNIRSIFIHERVIQWNDQMHLENRDICANLSLYLITTGAHWLVQCLWNISIISEMEQNQQKICQNQPEIRSAYFLCARNSKCATFIGLAQTNECIFYKLLIEIDNSYFYSIIERNWWAWHSSKVEKSFWCLFLCRIYASKCEIVDRRRI